MAENRIRALRKEAGYSQKELGDLLGMGQTTVSAWEIGRNEPDNEMAYKLAKLLGCSIGYLTGYEPESPHRGLSDEEWHSFIVGRLIEREIDKELQADKDDIQAWIEELERKQLDKEWEKGNRAIFQETKEIDAILERTNEDGRKRAVQVIELMFPYQEK